MGYREILLRLQCDKAILEIFDGKIKMPSHTFESPFDPAYGFPPSVIPICSTGSWPGYIGVAHHWFGTEPDSFVRYNSEDSEIIEIARDIDQFRAWLVFDFICNVPDADEVGEFSEAIGFCERSRLDSYFSSCDDPEDLVNLEVFSSNVPSVLATPNGSPGWISNFGSFEHLVHSGKVDLAWYSLSSPGWTASEVAVRLNELRVFRSDKDFSELVSSWNSCNGKTWWW